MKKFAFSAAAAALIVSGFAQAQSAKTRDIVGTEALDLYTKIDRDPRTDRDPAYDVSILRNDNVECIMKDAHGSNSDQASVICHIAE